MDSSANTNVTTAVKEEVSELDRIFMEAGKETAAVPSTTVSSAPTIDIPLNELTEEEQKQVDDIASKLDVKDAAAVMAFGAGTQQKMAEFSERTLESVKTKDMGEVGDMITNLIGELKNFDVDENEKGLFAFFKKGANKLQNMKTKYSKVETNVKTIQNELGANPVDEDLQELEEAAKKKAAEEEAAKKAADASSKTSYEKRCEVQTNAYAAHNPHIKKEEK